MSDGAVAGAELRQFVERIQRLEGEIRDLNADKSEVFKEAKGRGFDVPAMRRCIALLRKDDGERQEELAMIELYMAELDPSLARARAREEA